MLQADSFSGKKQVQAAQSGHVAAGRSQAFQPIWWRLLASGRSALTTLAEYHSALLECVMSLVITTNWVKNAVRVCSAAFCC